MWSCIFATQLMINGGQSYCLRQNIIHSENDGLWESTAQRARQKTRLLTGDDQINCHNLVSEPIGQFSHQ
jgi:hypothetical protein